MDLEKQNALLHLVRQQENDDYGVTNKMYFCFLDQIKQNLNTFRKKVTILVLND